MTKDGRKEVWGIGHGFRVVCRWRWVDWLNYLGRQLRPIIWTSQLNSYATAEYRNKRWRRWLSFLSYLLCGNLCITARAIAIMAILNFCRVATTTRKTDRELCVSLIYTPECAWLSSSLGRNSLKYRMVSLFWVLNWCRSATLMHFFQKSCTQEKQKQQWRPFCYFSYSLISSSQ